MAKIKWKAGDEKKTVEQGMDAVFRALIEKDERYRDQMIKRLRRGFLWWNPYQQIYAVAWELYGREGAMESDELVAHAAKSAMCLAFEYFSGFKDFKLRDVKTPKYLEKEACLRLPETLTMDGILLGMAEIQNYMAELRDPDIGRAIATNEQVKTGLESIGSRYDDRFISALMTINGGVLHDGRWLKSSTR